MEDSKLVNKYINGDENALETLIHKYNGRLFSFIYSKVKNREVSNDIFQDTFVKAIRNLKSGKYREEGKFYPWLKKIAGNIIIDYFRKHKRMSKFESVCEYDIFSTISDGKPTREKKMIVGEINDTLHLLIEELPVDQRKVLMLRIYEGFSFKDISEDLNISINTALGRMRYAIRNLRKIVDEKSIVLTF
ncbi:RNA polymerase sigma factor [uncultured Croceitalea sp.]|uniref:RNA polymerase sigma factor n=1 Tax=uncultured Croceitalea sp. TaxID=1798908 RepID=UPI0033059BC8